MITSHVLLTFSSTHLRQKTADTAGDCHVSFAGIWPFNATNVTLLMATD